MLVLLTRFVVIAVKCEFLCFLVLVTSCNVGVHSFVCLRFQSSFYESLVCHIQVILGPAELIVFV